MNRSLWIAKSGMEAPAAQAGHHLQQSSANVSTNGYKRAGAVFEDLMYDSLRQAGAASSDQTTLAHRACRLELGRARVGVDAQLQPGQPAAD